MQILKIEVDNEQEIRDGFIVTQKRKKIWNIQLDLLEQLLLLCKENEIKCFAVWGTLLGAVRHKGFIPWDDDIDIGLFRLDYDKLCKIAPSYFKAPYFFQNSYTDTRFFLPFTRLRNSNTTGIVCGNLDKSYNNGIYIDIYPLDGVTENRYKAYFQQMRIRLFARIARIKNEEQKHQKSITGKIKNTILLFFSKFYTYEKACNYHDYWCKKYNDISQMVGLVYHPGLVNKYKFYKEDAKYCIMVPFEQLKIPIPKEFHKILSNIYGDYMQFPPLGERGEWHSGQIIWDPDVAYQEYIDRLLK